MIIKELVEEYARETIKNFEKVWGRKPDKGETFLLADYFKDELKKERKRNPKK